MDTNPQGQDTKQALATGLSRAEADQSRRALLRMGAGASPVLLTLASGPAAAQACVVASVYMSADTFASRFQGQALQCGSPLTPAARVTSRGAAPAGEYLNADGTVKKVKDVLGDIQSNATAIGYCNQTVYDTFAGTSAYPSATGVLQLLLTLQMAGNPGILVANYAQGIWLNYAGVNSFTKYTATGIDWYTDTLWTYLNRIVDSSVP
jgi:hypothetical protein